MLYKNLFGICTNKYWCYAMEEERFGHNTEEDNTFFLSLCQVFLSATSGAEETCQIQVVL